MLFIYNAIDQTGAEKKGAIDALNMDIAVSSLQRRGLVIVSIIPADAKKSLLSGDIKFLEHVSVKDIVILSRQMSTLFQAQVSALRVFRLLGEETENKTLKKHLTEVADDLQAGSSISSALEKHPKIFSEFYVSMVKSGEESGKLDEIFGFLADYLDRYYELTSKVRGALIYPAFVVFTFITVMILMFTVVIPKISVIIEESGQEIPIYTKVIMAISNFLVDYGFIIGGVFIVAVIFFVRYVRTPSGRVWFDGFKLRIPGFKILFKKLYLSRIADNMNTMLSSGISMVRGLELTARVVNNKIYQNVLDKSMEGVKTGRSLSEAFSMYPNQIPGIMVQMVKVGEETGELGSILKTLSNFYAREVKNAVDSLVDLIEPAMIVLLGLGVAILLASVLVPIYNISSAQ